jgi:hypothetical protein
MVQSHSSRLPNSILKAWIEQVFNETEILYCAVELIKKTFGQQSVLRTNASRDLEIKMRIPLGTSHVCTVI